MRFGGIDRQIPTYLLKTCIGKAATPKIAPWLISSTSAVLATTCAAMEICDLEGYLEKNKSGVINYSAWRKAGRRISTSAVEGTVNRLIGRRMCKSQHMCWTTRGAHMLLQVRCAVMNGDFLAGFRRWFPNVGSRHIMLPWNWLPQQ